MSMSQDSHNVGRCGNTVRFPALCVGSGDNKSLYFVHRPGVRPERGNGYKSKYGFTP